MFGIGTLCWPYTILLAAEIKRKQERENKMRMEVHTHTLINGETVTMCAQLPRGITLYQNNSGDMFVVNDGQVIRTAKRIGCKLEEWTHVYDKHRGSRGPNGAPHVG